MLFEAPRSPSSAERRRRELAKHRTPDHDGGRLAAELRCRSRHAEFPTIGTPASHPSALTSAPSTMARA